MFWHVLEFTFIYFEEDVLEAVFSPIFYERAQPTDLCQQKENAKVLRECWFESLFLPSVIGARYWLLAENGYYVSVSYTSAICVVLVFSRIRIHSKIVIGCCVCFCVGALFPAHLQ